MIYVARDNEGNGSMKRYKKDSFEWYKNVIHTNGEELQEAGPNQALLLKCGSGFWYDLTQYPVMGIDY
ncbi:hypothetical protein C0W65_08865 [Bacillus subtilis]|nr:hypothetical protein C0W65_08865 [Bacillus subtilis]